MKKKIIAIGLILNLMITPVITGCADSDNASDNTEATSNTASENNAESSNNISEQKYFSEYYGLPTPNSVNSNIDFEEYSDGVYKYNCYSFDEVDDYITALYDADFMLGEDQAEGDNSILSIIYNEDEEVVALLGIYKFTDNLYELSVSI